MQTENPSSVKIVFNGMILKVVEVKLHFFYGFIQVVLCEITLSFRCAKVSLMSNITS